ncbi:phosphate acyltransferase [Flavobacterium daejeonense]|uniref:phosphate acyltransferase n=1 Tax=Flavobacterium daejeonense TaxID=350893 RepID=UPI000AD761B5|nr:phosphate acyltransferase [Flavobacterium daejeonense]
MDVLKAAQLAFEEGIATPVLLGDRETILELKKKIDFNADITIIDMHSEESKGIRAQYAEKFWNKRKRNCITLYSAQAKMRERNYFAAIMIHDGDADGMISGYSRVYSTVVKPVFEVIGKVVNVKKAAIANILTTERGPMFLADRAINIEPTAEELADITKMTANVATAFGFDPVVVMLSYSNFGSSTHSNATKVREAVEILHSSVPELVVDRDIQFDFALNMELLQSKFSFSKLAGKKVNTLIFPNFEASNITYKLLKELNKADSIGPIMLGLSKSVHILQLGASVNEIVNI